MDAVEKWETDVGNKIIIEQVLMLFIILLIGAAAKKRGIITADSGRKLSELLLNVTQPFMIISSFQFDFSRDMLLNAGLVFVCSLGIHAISMVVAMFIYRKYPMPQRNVLKFITVFSNCGFMGFPVLDSVLGSIGVFYGSIYVISFNIFIWTYGVMVFSGGSGGSSWKKVFINPGIISVCIGMILFLFSIKLPGPIYKAVSMVGSMTTPLSMLIVGSLLADIKFSELFKGLAVYHGTAVRLAVIPLLSFAVLSLFPIPDEVRFVSILLPAMPAAANTAIFSEKYEGDSSLASRIIGITTLLSIATIPLIIMLI